ncbi:beta-N-acetylhexosaminidase, partial [Bacteroides xylanisolvens]
TVVISISDDGTHFTELRKQHFEVSKETPIRFTDISWQGEAKGRYVRYQAQAGSEFGGWIFTDEIIVK